jgi:hypothetical protein
MPAMTRVLGVAVLLSLALAAGAQTSDTSAEALRAEIVFWESIRNSTDPADFRAYLEQYPGGKFAALARNRLGAIEPKPEPAAPSTQATPAPAAIGAPSALAVGDSWIYRIVDPRSRSQRGIQEVRLAALTPDKIVEEVLSEKGSTFRAEHRKGHYLLPAGDLTVFSPYLIAFSAPQFGLRFGGIDNLDSRTCNAGWTCSVSGWVAGRDRVGVPAGIFEAIKIEVYQSWTSPSQTNDRGETVSRTLTVWYAPEVKRAVKLVSRGGPSRFIDTEFDLELMSYQLK